MSVRRFRPSLPSDAGHVHTLATPHYAAVRGILCGPSTYVSVT